MFEQKPNPLTVVSPAVAASLSRGHDEGQLAVVFRFGKQAYVPNSGFGGPNALHDETKLNAL